MNHSITITIRVLECHDSSVVQIKYLGGGEDTERNEV